MLLCLGLIAVLLYDTVFGSVTTCVHTFDKAPGRIEAHSRHLAHFDRPRCEYLVRAPFDTTVVVNITLLHGFERTPEVEPATAISPPPSRCLPSLQMAEVRPDGSLTVIRTVCPPSPASSHVLSFRSRTAQIRVTYVWLPHRPSAFVLYFDFVRLRKDSSEDILVSGPCEFTCSERGCLSSWSLVCNGVADCPDQSDELDCPLPLPSSGSPSSHSNASSDDVFSIQIIIIVIAVLVTLTIFTCVLSHYKMGARSWSEGRTARQHHPPPHHNPAAAVTTGQTQRLQPDSHRPNQLHPASSVLYVPVSNQERLLREKVSLQDRQTRIKSVRLDLELGLPPSLPLPDGEEPYGSLQNFHMRDPEQEREIYSKCIRPPPNRTVFEGGSPPPYRSNSHGSESGNLTPPRDCNGTQLVMRCHSANNNAAATRNGNMGAAGAARNSTSASSVLRCSSHSHHHLHPHPHPHQQHLSALPATTNLVLAPMARHSASCAPDGEPPPGYSEAIATSGGQQPNNGV